MTASIQPEPDYDGQLAPILAMKPSRRLALRTSDDEKTVVAVRDVVIGGPDVVLMAGPCTVESRSQLFAIAERVAAAGARILRGGAYKPRTSPYSFQGLGVEALELLREAADTFGLAVVSEVMDVSQIETMLPYVDILQVGARNMQNFNLLAALGDIRKPVLLKRGMSATIDEWLYASEYILAGGNRDVILCERGIRTFETATRNTLDISAISVVQELSHLPVIVDPSHASGVRGRVPSLSKAAIAAGADGLLIEVHHEPDRALCDGAQSLLPEQFDALAQDIGLIAGAVGRGVAAKVAR